MVVYFLGTGSVSVWIENNPHMEDCLKSVRSIYFIVTHLFVENSSLYCREVSSFFFSFVFSEVDPRKELPLISFDVSENSRLVTNDREQTSQLNKC